MDLMRHSGTFSSCTLTPADTHTHIHTHYLVLCCALGDCTPKQQPSISPGSSVMSILHHLDFHSLCSVIIARRNAGPVLNYVHMHKIYTDQLTRVNFWKWMQSPIWFFHSNVNSCSSSFDVHTVLAWNVYGIYLALSTNYRCCTILFMHYINILFLMDVLEVKDLIQKGSKIDKNKWNANVSNITPRYFILRYYIFKILYYIFSPFLNVLI